MSVKRRFEQAIPEQAIPMFVGWAFESVHDYFEQHFKEVKIMHGVTSTGNNAKNRSTSGEGSSTGTTQGQMQGGRSVQRQTSVLPAIKLFFSAMAATSTTTTVIPGTSRQVTGGDATESVRPRKRQCVQKPLPELRYSAARDTFIRAEEGLMLAKAAKKPEGSEAGKSHRPEAADARTSELSSVFEHKVSESFKELAIQQDASGEKNTLPLCRVIIGKMIECIDEIDKIDSEITAATRKSLRKLEANSNIWAQHDALPLCRAVVEEIAILENDANYCRFGIGCARRVITPVYMLALSGGLAELEQHPVDQWSLQSLRTLLDVSLCLNFGFERNAGILLLDNVTMLKELYHRPVACGVLGNAKRQLLNRLIAQSAVRISFLVRELKNRLGYGDKTGRLAMSMELCSIARDLKDMSDLIKIGGFFDPSGAVRS